MGVIRTIGLGFVIGLIAKRVVPGKENLGIIVIILLGIAESDTDNSFTVPKNYIAFNKVL